MNAQETLRLARALHAAPDSTAAFWEARQHTLDKQASHSSCITGLVSYRQIYHVCHGYATRAGTASCMWPLSVCAVMGEAALLLTLLLSRGELL